MNLLWFAQTLISSVIGAVVFIGIGGLIGWWKVWRHHGEAIKAMLDREGEQ